MLKSTCKFANRQIRTWRVSSVFVALIHGYYFTLFSPIRSLLCVTEMCARVHHLHIGKQKIRLVQGPTNLFRHQQHPRVKMVAIRKVAMMSLTTKTGDGFCLGLVPKPWYSSCCISFLWLDGACIQRTHKHTHKRNATISYVHSIATYFHFHFALSFVQRRVYFEQNSESSAFLSKATLEE